MATKTTENTKEEIQTDAESSPPHRITNDDLYRRSTQYRFWSFTQSKLEDLRILANKKGIRVTNERLEALDPLLPETKIIKENQSEFHYVTCEEELLLVSFYARKCKELATFFHLPAQARSTAIMYLFKFYLYHSVMEYHPFNIMLTCLFMAAKVENNFIGINSFSKNIPKTTPESILKHEYLILETMRFSLLCHHPFQPLYGFFLDIQQLLPKLDFNRLGKSYDGARELVNESLFTNLPFLYTPPQIALACLWMSDDVLVERYLSKKFGLKRKKNGAKLDVIAEEIKDSEDQEEKSGTPITTEETTPPVDNEKTTDAPQKLTPSQHYEKMMNLIKDCAKILRTKSLNPTPEESKVVSVKTSHCLEPIKFGKKLLKKKNATTTSGSEDSSSTKRPNSEEGGDSKRPKLE